MADTDVLALRGQDWQALSRLKRKAMVERAFHYWRTTGFPHYDLSEKDVSREYANLCRQPIATLSQAGIAGSICGLRLANFFQPQMWGVRVSRYLSPRDVFEDDVLLRAALLRSWSIWPDRCGANAATLRRILKSFPGAASVSNFRPTVSRAILQHFSKDKDHVVDFCAGYGGRLLGALSLNRNYTGIEPCKAQVKGLKAMLQKLKASGVAGSGEILAGCAEDLMPLLPARSADLVFSSPPYFNWEKYSEEGSQSFIRFNAYEGWKEGFLMPIIAQSFRVLKRGGKLVMNVSMGRRRPNASDVMPIGMAAGFRFVECFPLLITRIPYLHPRNDAPHKSEALLVFRKP